MPSYRVLKRYETDEREDLIVQVTMKVANSLLRLPSLPRHSFIQETDEATGLEVAEPVNGLHRFGEIYLLGGLTDATLILVTAHEVRHYFQFKTKTFRPRVQLERDAAIFSLEFDCLLGQPPASKIVARLVTVYGMKCGKELSRYITDVLLNQKGDRKDGTHKFEF